MLAEDPDVVLIDCRTPQEYQVARIDGAQLVPLDQMMVRMEDLDEYRDRKIVVHCHHGMRSLQMTAVLRQHGFTDVKSMAGGIDLWSLDIDPSVPRY
jgi:rhodanese-related sulfurtransferase